VSLVSLRALPSIGIVHTRWLAVALGLGAGLDVLTVAPRSDELPESTLGTQSSRVDVLLSAVARAEIAIAAGVVFVVAVGGDVDLDSRRYVLEEGAMATAVLSPWRVRPSLLAGFAFTALGDGQFAGAR
jgi:hypothetical protein